METSFTGQASESSSPAAEGLIGRASAGGAEAGVELAAPSPPLLGEQTSSIPRPVGDLAAAIPSLTAELPGYRLLRVIGHGGQGQVFQAIRLADGLKVAIKFILPGRLADLASRARFEEERRTLELLNHPGIVRILDHGALASGELWFAAEYIDGIPVNQYVHDLDRVALAQAGPSTRPAFPLDKVLDLFTRICEAVEAAHQAGVLHRDLKPANILVDDDGRPHILDFGLARGPQRQCADAVTLTGQFMGSPAWSSPEQIEARPSLIDARTDVYSIGMMLYHALTGDFPFDVSQPWPQLFETIRTAEPTPPRQLRSFIDADLQTIVLTAIARSKERRYASVAALREDLQRYRAGRPIRARPDSRLYRLSKFVQRNRLLVASVAIVIVLTAGYAISVTYMYRRAEDHAADARAKFRAARDMLDFTLSQVDVELKKLAGASTVRRDLLEKAYGQLDALLKEKTDDPELQADIAKTHSRLADIAQALGRLDSAGQDAAAALEIRKQLASENPADPEAQAELSIALVRVGDIARAQSCKQKGRELFEQALRIDEALVKAHPNNRHYLDNLAWSYDRLCWAAIGDDDMPSAADFHEKRLTLARRLVAIDSASTVHRKNLLAALLQTSHLGAIGTPPHGLTLAQRADEAGQLLEPLLANEPQNPEYLALAATLHKLRVDVANAEGRFEDARSEALESLAIIDGFLAAEPEHRDWCWQRLVTMRELGCCAVRTSKQQEALERFTQAVAYGEVLSARLPDDLDLWRVLADTRLELGKELWQIGRVDEARDSFHKAIVLFRRCVAHPRASAGYYASLAESLATCPVQELRDPSAAFEIAKKGVELSRRRSPTLLLSLALCQKANGQISQARDTAEEALALLNPGPNPTRKQIEDLIATLASP